METVLSVCCQSAGWVWYLGVEVNVWRGVSFGGDATFAVYGDFGWLAL